MNEETEDTIISIVGFIIIISTFLAFTFVGIMIFDVLAHTGDYDQYGNPHETALWLEPVYIFMFGK